MASQRIKKNTQTPVIQQKMDEAIGSVYWTTRSHDQWRKLLAARNAFVRYKIESIGLSIAQFQALPSGPKRSRIARLNFAFSAEFFPFTRDGDWMQEAVGEDGRWVHVSGMREWHVNAAIRKLKDQRALQRRRLPEPGH